MPEQPHEIPSIASAFEAAEKAVGAVAADGRRIIQWKAGELPRVVDEAEQALMRCEHDILFQRGPLVVRVVRRQSMSVRTFRRPAGGLGISTVDKSYLIEQMSRAAYW